MDWTGFSVDCLVSCLHVEIIIWWEGYEDERGESRLTASDSLWGRVGALLEGVGVVFICCGRGSRELANLGHWDWRVGLVVHRVSHSA